MVKIVGNCPKIIVRSRLGRFFPVLRAKKDFSSESKCFHVVFDCCLGEHAQRIDLLLKEVRSLKRDSWKYRDIGEIMQDSCSVDSKFK